MAIKCFGKFYSWEDTLYFPGHDNDDESQYIRILGHRLPNGSQYRPPTSDPEADVSLCSGIYLLHDSNREVVYVGQARVLATRLNAHTGDHLRGRWTHFSWFSTSEPAAPSETAPVRTDRFDEKDSEGLSGTLSLDLLEAILRTSLEPRLNLQGGRWGNSVTQYAQSLEYEWIYSRELFEQNHKILKRTKKILSNTKKLNRKIT